MIVPAYLSLGTKFSRNNSRFTEDYSLATIRIVPVSARAVQLYVSLVAKFESSTRGESKFLYQIISKFSIMKVPVFPSLGAKFSRNNIRFTDVLDLQPGYYSNSTCLW
jgi:hypothetical protein